MTMRERPHQCSHITASHRTMVMTTISTEEPQFQAAIEACAIALKRMASYEFNVTFRQRMHELGERKAYPPSLRWDS